ncbi:hypothetical protein OCU04_008323 [Sclerotinia nivalis]|uniref:Major facilitator superfamily (MFS) profile domain-containing protein n=1 Tax=Sclerotinia nivalis TaxID=352851 RepID=A0A9X0AHX5_9HELO|nr:hypothetical protein OCU04_008323 [Sclerotinia nivalis]
MFSPSQRGLPMPLIAVAPFLGPTIGPIAGGFLAESAGWRWVAAFDGYFSRSYVDRRGTLHPRDVCASASPETLPCFIENDRASTSDERRPRR